MTECNAIIEANNEIDRLKEENEKLNALCIKYGFEMGELEEENEQLKNEVYDWKASAEDYLKLGQSLKNENEQLKQELAIYRKVASCSNCKYHNYYWYDDGDEFEVCDKGNDVTDGICEDWEEL